jgi:hypothetical protein
MGSIFIKFFVTQFLIFASPRMESMVAKWCASRARRQRTTELPPEALMEFEAEAAPGPRRYRICRHDAADPDDDTSLFETVGLVVQLTVFCLAQLYFVQFVGILHVFLCVPLRIFYTIITSNTGQEALRQNVVYVKRVFIFGTATTGIYLVAQEFLQLDDFEQAVIDVICKTVVGFFNSFSESNSKYLE